MPNLDWLDGLKSRPIDDEIVMASENVMRAVIEQLAKHGVPYAFLDFPSQLLLNARFSERCENVKRDFDELTADPAYWTRLHTIPTVPATMQLPGGRAAFDRIVEELPRYDVASIDMDAEREPEGLAYWSDEKAIREMCSDDTREMYWDLVFKMSNPNANAGDLVASLLDPRLARQLGLA